MARAAPVGNAWPSSVMRTRCNGCLVSADVTRPRTVADAADPAAASRGGTVACCDAVESATDSNSHDVQVIGRVPVACEGILDAAP